MKNFIAQNKNSIFILICLIILFLIRITPLNNTQIIEDQISINTPVVNNYNKEDHIYIEVVGAVNNPGVFYVTDNILVFDAIKLASGFSSDADLDYVDQYIPLSKRVYSEMKIYIPNKVDKLVGGIKFYINTATKEQLIAIKGIGEVTAGKIIDNRPFYNWNDLEEITGIRQDALSELKSKAWL
jgi:DNA uptake protein ComE-like DNA-binding protein